MSSSRTGLFVLILTVGVGLPINCNELSPADLKAAITAENSWQFVGLGGRNSYLNDVASKLKITQASIFPPKSIYEFAKDENIKKIKPDNMAAVSLRYTDSRNLITSSNIVIQKGSAQAGILGELRTLFQAGNYFEAISKMIGYYQSNPDKDGKSQDRIDTYIKQGIADALEIHVKNGLITAAQKQQLIGTFNLNVKSPVFNVILNSPLRDRARELLLYDIQKYVRPARIFY